MALMDSLNIPFVLVDRFYPEVKGCSVIVDHDEGGYLAARHLLELGHTRIGCVGGQRIWLIPTGGRRAIYGH